jgi:DNA-binding transcriptional regulator YdaS (Cro superfamily)
VNQRRFKKPSAIPPDQIKDQGLRLAVAKLGNFNALAKALGISPAALMEWKKIPSHRILQVEAVTRVKRENLRPDLYRERSQTSTDKRARKHPMEIPENIIAALKAIVNWSRGSDDLVDEILENDVPVLDRWLVANGLLPENTYEDDDAND